MSATRKGAPTLGTDALLWMEDDAELVHGAGGVQGDRVRWLPDPDRGIPGDPERCGIIQRAYELWPSPVCDHCGQWNDVEPWDYRRKVKGRWVGWTCPTKGCGRPLPPVRACDHYKLSRAKGWSKSGLASKVGVIEAVGPSQFDGWGSDGEPVGVPHRAPLVRCYATEEGQSDHTYKPLAYMLRVLGDTSWARRNQVHIDAGIDEAQKSTMVHLRTTYGTRGRVEPRTSSGASAAGGQTTCALCDETWLWKSRAMWELYNNEVLNVAKSENPGWVLETSTYPEPGAGSVAEATQEDGGLPPPHGRYVDHRGFRTNDWLVDASSRQIDREKFAAECAHAYGDATWAYNLPSRLAMFRRTELDLGSLIRQFGNAKADVADRYVTATAWEACRDDVDPGWQPPDGEWITVGFDGSLVDDHTGLLGLHIPTSRLFVIGHWDPADNPTDEHPDGHVDEREVDATVSTSFQTWHLPRLYADPPQWRSWVSMWMQRHGNAVKTFETKSIQRMTPALRAFREAVLAGTVRHTGHPTLTRHVLNAVLVTDAARVRDPELYPDGRRWRLAKPSTTKHDPGNKIDLSICGVLAWSAGLDSRAADEKPKSRTRAKVRSY